MATSNGNPSSTSRFERFGFPPAFVRSLKTFSRIWSDRRENGGKKRVIIPAWAAVWGGSAYAAYTYDLSGDFITVLATVLSILAGFLINLMLYTGNASNIQRLNASNAERIKAHILFLLRFQIRTFGFYIKTVIFGVVWFVAPNELSKNIAEAVIIAAGVFSLAYSLALPYQLYDIHLFLLEVTVNEKRETERREASERRRASVVYGNDQGR